MSRRSTLWLAIAAAVMIPWFASLAQADNWYSKLVGGSGEDAKDQLHGRGFEKVQSFDTAKHSTVSVWYNKSSRHCLQLITVDSRVDSAVALDAHAECGASGNASGHSGQGHWYKRLVGEPRDDAEHQLHGHGFHKVDNFDSGQHAAGAVWYNGSTRQCLQVITANGRVDSALDIESHPKCHG